jgi:AcrR family transcriptional regulator
MFIPGTMTRQIETPMSAAASLPSSDKREAILVAALELFAQRGFYGTAVPDIATLAKVGAGTIYRYFPSKEALVNALYQHHKARMAETLIGGLDPTAPSRKVFSEFWKRTCRFARDNTLVLQFLELQHHAPYLDEESRRIERSLVGMATTFLQHGIAQEVFRDMNPSVLSSIVWGAFRGIFQGGCDGTLTLDDETIATTEQCVWEAIRR